MPTLLINSRRANDVIISNGSRWKIDWATSSLRPYPEPPPAYANDDDDTATAISTVPSLAPDRPQLRASRSATTVNESAGSSVEESPGTRRLIKDTMGGWGRRIKFKRRDGAVNEGVVLEEKVQRGANAEASEV